MRNQFLLFVGFMVLGFNSTAQVKLGVNVSYHEALGQAESVTLVDNRGYQVYDFGYLGQESSSSFGVVVYAENDKMFFMPALNYRVSTSNFQFMNYAEVANGNVEASLKTQSIHMPITAGLKVDKFRIGAGPDFTLILDRTENLSEFEDVEYNERGFNAGFHFNIGYDPIPQIKLNLGYEMSFSGVTTDYRFNGKPLPFNATPKLLNFSIAVFM